LIILTLIYSTLLFFSKYNFIMMYKCVGVKTKKI
jgi:hypothetical protein